MCAKAHTEPVRKDAGSDKPMFELLNGSFCELMLLAYLSVADAKCLLSKTHTFVPECDAQPRSR